jgi:hypothetical protein
VADDLHNRLVAGLGKVVISVCRVVVIIGSFTLASFRTWRHFWL